MECLPPSLSNSQLRAVKWRSNTNAFRHGQDMNGSWRLFEVSADIVCMPDKSSLHFSNARLAFPDFVLEGELLAEDGKIAALSIEEKLTHIPARARRIDCQGQILAPG